MISYLRLAIGPHFTRFQGKPSDEIPGKTTIQVKQPDTVDASYIGVRCLNRVQMNNINPKKLLNSKWTAVNPSRKEKHFLVSEIEFDEEGVVVSCSIEAVISKRFILIDWRDLKDESSWAHGWK